MKEMTNATKGTVLIVRLERVPRKRDIILTNEEFRKIIKGNLEIIKIRECSAAFIFDKDRKELDLPLNRALFNKNQELSHLLFGTFIVVGLDEKLNFTSLSEEQLRYFKNRFYVPAKMVTVDGKPRIVFDLMVR